jgi:glycerol kinase
MAFSVRDMADAMAEATATPWRELRADGGASVMGLLLQLLADQVQAPVVRPRTTESTALGAALLAGIAEGVWDSVEQTTGLWQPDDERRPQIDQPTADAAYVRWLDAVERARGWDHPPD